MRFWNPQLFDHTGWRLWERSPTSLTGTRLGKVFDRLSGRARELKTKQCTIFCSFYVRLNGIGWCSVVAKWQCLQNQLVVVASSSLKWAQRCNFVCTESMNKYNALSSPHTESCFICTSFQFPLSFQFQFNFVSQFLLLLKTATILPFFPSRVDYANMKKES